MRWTQGTARGVEGALRARDARGLPLRRERGKSASGAASFTTIYPGWYSGRAVHIHVKARLFDSANNVTTEATAQIFFDEAVSDTVLRTASPYSSRPTRDTRNAADGIYGNQTVLLASLQGDAASGYSATFPLAVRVGQASAG